MPGLKEWPEYEYIRYSGEGLVDGPAKVTLTDEQFLASGAMLLDLLSQPYVLHAYKINDGRIRVEFWPRPSEPEEQ